MSLTNSILLAGLPGAGWRRRLTPAVRTGSIRAAAKQKVAPQVAESDRAPHHAPRVPSHLKLEVKSVLDVLHGVVNGVLDILHGVMHGVGGALHRIDYLLFQRLQFLRQGS